MKNKKFDEWFERNFPKPTTYGASVKHTEIHVEKMRNYDQIYWAAKKAWARAVRLERGVKRAMKATNKSKLVFRGKGETR